MNTDLAAQHAMDRLAKVGFDGLSEVDQVLATVWMFAAGVANQGFAGYFSGRRGDLACHAPSALDRIGAHALAELAREANALFGPDGPPCDFGARCAQVKGLGPPARRRLEQLDDRYFACQEDVDDFLEAFLIQSMSTR